MKKDRARPRELNPSVKHLIYYRAITQRKVPREFLAIQLINEIEDAGEIPPTIDTAKKYISKARNIDNPLDKPWSIASCGEYTPFFTPESISALMDYKKWAQELFTDVYGEYMALFGVSPSQISIRHAIWIIRLKPLIEKLFADLMENDDNIRLGYPFNIAMIYAIAETTCEMLNESFVSTGLDSALISKDLNSLAKIGGLSLMASSKPIECIHNCESCKYQQIPGFPTLCMPKRKENNK